MKPVQSNIPFSLRRRYFSSGWSILGLVLLVVQPLAGDEAADPGSIQQPRSDSDAAFETILQVLKSPRCLNCHPTDDHPRQGDDLAVHNFGVVRGSADHGGPVQECATCHRDENNTYSRIPGAPHWGLAPRSMGWIGLSDEEIHRRLVDPASNGGRSLEELVEHMSHDLLVLWAWEPGEGREPPPVSLEDFRVALSDWLESYTPTERSQPEEEP